jgi:mono/diheme cytochrome c family protein
MQKWITGALLVVTAGCGDPKTNDQRGYTKAPLEQPRVLVKGEAASQMSELGDPILPEAPVYEPEAPADTQKTAVEPGAQPDAAAQLPAGVSAADVQEGEKIFTSSGNCFTCHGPNGTGTALAPALNESQWLNIDGSFESIQNVVKSGVLKPKQHPAPMPAMGGATLSEAQLKQVAAYVYSISR